MFQSKTVSAIILAAGSGTRFGGDINKVYLELGQKKVLQYSIDEFLLNKYIDEIIVVIKDGEDELYKKLGYNIKTVYGGETRKDSVYNALKEAKGEIVIIHDGARPFITQDFINNSIETMQFFKATTVGVKVKDTIKLVDENNVVIETVDRSKAWQIQTPQCFDKGTLIKAHESYNNDISNVVDDCMLMEEIGETVRIIEGDYTNIKITTKEDIQLAKNFS